MAAALLARAVLRHRPSALALPRARPVLFFSDDSGRRALDALWATPGLLKFQFSRSSGPGGQHVNKVNTRAELRLDVPRAVGSAALPADVAERLSGATTVEGVLAVSAQSLRTQKGNRDACETKLAAMLGAAWEPPPLYVYELSARDYGSPTGRERCVITTFPLYCWSNTIGPEVPRAKVPQLDRAAALKASASI